MLSAAVPRRAPGQFPVAPLPSPGVGTYVYNYALLWRAVVEMVALRLSRIASRPATEGSV